MNSTKVIDYKENVDIDESSKESENGNLEFTELEDKNVVNQLRENVKINEGEAEEKKKRKREEFCQGETGSDSVDKEKCSVFVDWSEEQDLALRKAYFVAKPSPHFWKKVSKMVPGKSAQECFDRVNGSMDTPPQRLPRSRAKERSCMSPIGNFELPGCTPIIHPIPIAKKLSSRKKSLVAQKTVRHLLRKHSTNDQNQVADHFSALETSPIQFAIDSPEPCSTIISPQGFSSSHKKTLSRFSKVIEPSPEVLKRIKNMALHEKYIDQLHNREARRKYEASSCRIVKVEGDNGSGVVKAAKSALMSEAKEAISHFRHVQVNLQENADDDSDDFDVGEDDKDDEE